MKVLNDYFGVTYKSCELHGIKLPRPGFLSYLLENGTADGRKYKYRVIRCVANSFGPGEDRRYAFIERAPKKARHSCEWKLVATLKSF